MEDSCFNLKTAWRFNLAAVSLGYQIVVFGGRLYASFHTYILSEDEGELGSDLSDQLSITGGMCSGSFTVQRGKVFAKGDSTWESVKIFDGKNWSLV